jgi:hypothetical protein
VWSADIYVNICIRKNVARNRDNNHGIDIIAAGTTEIVDVLQESTANNGLIFKRRFQIDWATEVERRAGRSC